MKQLTERFLHYAVLIAITAFAVGVLWRMSARGRNADQPNLSQVRPLPASSAPKAPVFVQPVAVETCEVLATYSGKIRPWETYQVGFEAPGRVLALGENSRGEPLDDGDRIAAGEVLAVLDERVFRALRGEAAARLEQAGSDLRRAQRVRETSRSAVSDSELQRLVTEQALARAQLEVAAKNLEDATLRSPVDATISRRLVNPGESVSAQQIAFELLENDDVLLVLNVPESQIRDLEARMRTIEAHLAHSSPDDAAKDLSLAEDSDPEQRLFRAHVQLEGRDLFNKPWPPLQGEVYRIAELADPQTSLFEVEVRLSNKERLLRPGMVATAQLVTDRIEGYRLPSVAVIYRDNRAHVFTTTEQAADLELLYWSLGPTTVHRARRVELDRWVEQPDGVIVPSATTTLDSVIIRGQHRLADGQLVRPMAHSAGDGDQRVDVVAGSMD